MRHVVRQLGLSVLIGAGVVLPFAVLEVKNRSAFDEGFPFPLFGFLWLLAAAFLLVVMPLVRPGRGGIEIVLRVAFLVVVGWLWGSLMLDQLPCFLGVPNCD